MTLKNREKYKRIKLAQNPSTPLDILRELAKDSHQDVRYEVGRNPSTPVDALRELARDEDIDVIRTVAENSNVDEVLYELAKTNVEYITYGLVQNNNSSSKVLITILKYEKSLNNPSPFIISETYYHQNCPDFLKSIIETLFKEML